MIIERMKEEMSTVIIGLSIPFVGTTAGPMKQRENVKKRASKGVRKLMFKKGLTC